MDVTKGFIWTDGRRREVLPIDARLPEILSAFHNNQVIVVQADTGAGKTTRIPQAILLANPDIQIWMTQTRRNAVRWNGKRICQEMGCEPGELVGWKLFGEEPMISKETRLTLCIDQSLTNRIRNNSGRLPEGLLIIDEAHERSIWIDLLLGLIKEALPSSPNTKVLVTSATIDTEKFSKFFNNAPIIYVTGRCFPVSTRVVELMRWEHHSQAVGRVAGEVLEQFIQGELQTPTADGQVKRKVNFGTVLAFLPGKEDITNVMSVINRKAEELQCQDRVEILACHGESTPEEQDAIQVFLPQGVIRFVCGTEILRSSVTIPYTVGAIDSLQVKRSVINAKGVPHLTKISISKACAKQGEGRVGRIGPGFYIACGSEYHSLQQYPTPMILLGSVDNVALQVAAVGRSARDFAFIDAPASEKTEIAMARLKRLGALDDQEKITEVGEILVRFPLEPKNAKALITADRLEVLPETVITIGALEEEGFFFVPSKHQQENYDHIIVDEPLARLILSHFKKSSWSERWDKKSKPIDPSTVTFNELPPWLSPSGSYWKITCKGDYNKEFPENQKWIADLARKFFAGDSQSDFVAIVRAYRAFKAEERRLKLEDFEYREDADEEYESRDKRLRNWCRRWFINYKRLRQAENVIRQTREELANSPLHMANSLAYEREFNGEALTKALASGLTDSVLCRSEGYRHINFVGPLGELSLAYQSACPQDSKLILAGRTTGVSTRRGGEISLVDLAAPVKPEWLMEVMPQLCSQKNLGDHSYNSEKDLVVETQETFFVNLKVGSKSIESADKDKASETFRAWLAQEMKNERRGW